MRLLPTYREHEGVWMSANGHRAYLRGERPGCLIPDRAGWVETCTHHIARLRPGVQRTYTRELVMFYQPHKPWSDSQIHDEIAKAGLDQ
jgi:hypothetical protein